MGDSARNTRIISARHDSLISSAVQGQGGRAHVWQGEGGGTERGAFNDWLVLLDDHPVDDVFLVGDGSCHLGSLEEPPREHLRPYLNADDTVDLRAASRERNDDRRSKPRAALFFFLLTGSAEHPLLRGNCSRVRLSGNTTLVPS